MNPILINVFTITIYNIPTNPLMLSEKTVVEQKLEDAEHVISELQSLTLKYRTKWADTPKPAFNPKPTFTAGDITKYPEALKWTMGKKGVWEWAFALRKNGEQVEVAKPLVDLIASNNGSVELGEFVYIHKSGGVFINRKKK